MMQQNAKNTVISNALSLKANNNERHYLRMEISWYSDGASVDRCQPAKPTQQFVSVF